MSTDLNHGDSPPCITARRGGCVIKEILRSHRNRRSRGGFPLCSQPENHPVLALVEASRLLFCRSATPPCGDARRHLRLCVNIEFHDPFTGFPQIPPIAETMETRV